MSFKSTEFQCPCCNQSFMDQDFLDMLYQARQVAGVPFILNSAWRCSSHNKAVGGSVTSSHMVGNAVDIAATGSAARYQIIKGLMAAGFNRIGVAKTFVHVDNDPAKDDSVIWVY